MAAILHHYAGLPEATSGGHAPVYYWLDAFATNKNHGPDLRKSPDASFESVVHRCRALLLACKPWAAPACLTRAWCLYECLVAINAVSAHVFSPPLEHHAMRLALHIHHTPSLGLP